MRFRVKIDRPDGSQREVEFDSRYDATMVLESQIEETILENGESIATTTTPRYGERPDGTERPEIERIA